MAYDLSSAGDVAIRLSEALKGCAGLATATAAPAWIPVETTCSTARAPAAISAMVWQTDEEQSSLAVFRVWVWCWYGRGCEFGLVSAGQELGLVLS